MIANNSPLLSCVFLFFRLFFYFRCLVYVSFCLPPSTISAKSRPDDESTERQFTRLSAATIFFRRVLGEKQKNRSSPSVGKARPLTPSSTDSCGTRVTLSRGPKQTCPMAIRELNVHRGWFTADSPHHGPPRGAASVVPPCRRSWLGYPACARPSCCRCAAAARSPLPAAPLSLRAGRYSLPSVCALSVLCTSVCLSSARV